MNRRDSMSLAVKTTTLAVAAAFGTAWAAESAEVTALTKPESKVSFGLGYVDSDARRFGQYSGLNEQGVYGLLDFDIVNRNDATGTWLLIQGRDVGLESRELRFEHNRQGNWRYFLEYDRIPRFEPLRVTTAVQGIGSNFLRVPAASTRGPEVDLDTKRDAFKLGFDKIIAGNFAFEVRFKNEQKDGERIFARGTTGNAPQPAFGLFQFTPEPIDSTTQQLEATFSYGGQQLQVSGGYYGSLYRNKFNGLNISEFGGPATGLAGFTPIGLPPDNLSHQIFATGGYNFTPTTRGTFKLSYSKLTQDDAFVTGVPLAPGIGSNLDGEVETTFASVGFTARPLPQLSLNAQLRYEDRDDKTPVLVYFTPASGSTNGQNEPRSLETKYGKLEASYGLPMGFRLTGGVDYEERKRNTNPVRSVSHRDETEETSWRVELRRSLSDTLNGAVSYVNSDRDGSTFLTTVQANGTLGSNLIAPLHLADREREKWRLMLDWTPVDQFSLQFYYDDADDSYTPRTAQGLGPQSGKAETYSLDGTWTIAEGYQLTAWYSRNKNRLEQTTLTSAAQRWRAQVRNEGDAYGLGFRAKPMPKLEIGADLQYSDISDEFNQAAVTGAPIASLPEITTRMTTLKLFAKYDIQKNAGLKLNYVFDRWSSNDWTWTNWVYADGTRLINDSPQRVHFIGLSAYYRWQ